MISKVNFATATASAFMKSKIVNPQLFLHLFGIIIPTLTYYLCTATNDSTTCRLFAENAALVMLFFFAFGFVALAVKRPYLMLYSWVYTVLLCQFLKDCPANTFYYAKLQNKENCISVANLRLTDEDRFELNLDKINQLKVDILSISLESQNSKKIISDLSSVYPYAVDLGTIETGEQVHVLSKHKINFSLKSNYSEEPFVSWEIILDSSGRKKIEFLSFSIGEEVSEDPKKLANSFGSISNGIEKSRKNKPLLVLGDVPLHAWETQLRSFRNKLKVSDSRMDIDMGKSGKHIFFSEALRCVSYKSFENGVLGVYELSVPKIGNQNEPKYTISSR